MKVSFAPRPQLLLLPAQTLQFLLQNALGFLDGGLLPWGPVVAGANLAGYGREQFLAELLRAQEPLHTGDQVGLWRFDDQVEVVPH
jgi:hypothetical protein